MARSPRKLVKITASPARSRLALNFGNWRSAAAAILSTIAVTVSFAGAIRGDTIFQAKGIDYSLGDLLATDLDKVEQLQPRLRNARNDPPQVRAGAAKGPEA